MKLYVVDAFTTECFIGNPAGVVVLEESEPFPSEQFMCRLAGELKHSETVFARPLSSSRFHARYFTPTGEVALCGHATIALFSVLRDTIGLPADCVATTLAGDLRIRVAADSIWMDMAPPKVLLRFEEQQSAELYRVFGLGPLDNPEGLEPQIVSVGLSDILLPVRNQTTLEQAALDSSALTVLSKRYQVVGAHLFCLDDTHMYTAHCRNFAPLYGIEEESATGTSNGALTYYLYRNGLLQSGAVNRFLQGEAMGRPSTILTYLTERDGSVSIEVGGNAALLFSATLHTGL